MDISCLHHYTDMPLGLWFSMSCLKANNTGSPYCPHPTTMEISGSMQDEQEGHTTCSP
jgi:hypothetical protein